MARRRRARKSRLQCKVGIADASYEAPELQTERGTAAPDSDSNTAADRPKTKSRTFITLDAKEQLKTENINHSLVDADIVNADRQPKTNWENVEGNIEKNAENDYEAEDERQFESQDSLNISVETETLTRSDSIISVNTVRTFSDNQNRKTMDDNDYSDQQSKKTEEPASIRKYHDVASEGIRTVAECDNTAEIDKLGEEDFSNLITDSEQFKHVFVSKSAESLVTYQRPNILRRSESDIGVRSYVIKKIKERPKRKGRYDSDWQTPAINEDARIDYWNQFVNVIGVHAEAEFGMFADGEIFPEENPEKKTFLSTRVEISRNEKLIIN